MGSSEDCVQRLEAAGLLIWRLTNQRVIHDSKSLLTGTAGIRAIARRTNGFRRDPLVPEVPGQRMKL